ncbi:MAG: precorrin-2 C(20)-methyltransferase [Phreatobacter sp.]
MTVPGKTCSGKIALYGVGLGPGDPSYVTVKAREILDRADRLVHFCKKGQRGNARTIADRLIGADPAREIALVYPVTTEAPVDDAAYIDPMAAFYAASAARLAAEVDDGRLVAILCEGDPFFYGSLMHLWRRLAPLYPFEVIPGITGMSGAWTLAAAPITWGDDILTVLPGTLPEAELARRLGDTDAAVVMKIGRNFPKVRRALAAAGLIERAIYVERASMADQLILRLADKTDDEAPYFSMILVPGEGRRL